jgi:TP901 family phage tail tape measure protein
MTVSAKREARVELKSSAAGVDGGIREARRKLKQFEREQARSAKQAEREAARREKQLVRSAGGIGRSLLGTAASVGVGMLGVQAAGGLAGMASDVLDYEKALTRLQITANSTPAAMREYSKTIEASSLNTGINRNEILSAGAAYVALTGDMETATNSTSTWAKIAAATGSTVSDIAQTAAAMSQQMHIGPKDMEATFSALAAQGKAGAIELKDLAGVMSQIAPMWATFKGGTGLRGVQELGAALQVVKRGFGGDAGETVTGLQSMLVAITKNAGRFKAAGINVFDVDKNGKESMKDVFSIVDAISKSSLVKHPDLMEKAFGRVEAYRAYLQLSQNKDLLDKFVSESQDAGLINRDFNTYMESSSAKIEKSWNAVKLAIASAFTPERIQVFADVLSLAANKFMEVAHWIDANPGILEFQRNQKRLDKEDTDASLAGLNKQFAEGKISPARMREIADILSNFNYDVEGAHTTPSELGFTGQMTDVAKRQLGERLKRQLYGDVWDASPDLGDLGVGMGGSGGVGAAKRVGGIDPGLAAAAQFASQFTVNERTLASAMVSALQRAGITIQVGSDSLYRTARDSTALTTRPAPP